MSAADDTIEYMLDGHMEERACRAFMRAEMSQSELRERVRQRRFCDQRFERFFRTDGKRPNGASARRASSERSSGSESTKCRRAR